MIINKCSQKIIKKGIVLIDHRLLIIQLILTTAVAQRRHALRELAVTSQILGRVMTSLYVNAGWYPYHIRNLNDTIITHLVLFRIKFIQGGLLQQVGNSTFGQLPLEALQSFRTKSVNTAMNIHEKQSQASKPITNPLMDGRLSTHVQARLSTIISYAA